MELQIGLRDYDSAATAVVQMVKDATGEANRYANSMYLDGDYEEALKMLSLLNEAQVAGAALASIMLSKKALMERSR